MGLYKDTQGILNLFWKSIACLIKTLFGATFPKAYLSSSLWAKVHMRWNPSLNEGRGPEMVVLHESLAIWDAEKKLTIMVHDACIWEWG